MYPTAHVARLERELWRTRYEALERIVRRKNPALTAWLQKQDRSIFDQARSAFPPTDDVVLTLVALIGLYRVLAAPDNLRGHGQKKRRRGQKKRRRDPLLHNPGVLYIHFEEICHALHRLWRPKHGLRVGVHVLMSKHLPAVYKRIQIPHGCQPKEPEIQNWAKSKSVDWFAYDLLAYAREMGAHDLRRVISRHRSGLKKLGFDALPVHLRDWRSQKGLSRSSARSK